MINCDSIKTQNKQHWQYLLIEPIHLRLRMMTHLLQLCKSHFLDFWHSHTVFVLSLDPSKLIHINNVYIIDPMIGTALYIWSHCLISQALPGAAPIPLPMTPSPPIAQTAPIKAEMPFTTLVLICLFLIP